MDQEVKRRRIDSIVATGGAVVVAVAVVEWHLLPHELIPSILSYFDVRTLIQTKQVSRNWRQICTNVINVKRTSRTGKVFETNQELRAAVKRYCNACSPDAAEEIAQTYGWPIGRWGVSNLQDFSSIFRSQRRFNEDISAWDVSNAITMFRMFFGAKMFNQDLLCLGTRQMSQLQRACFLGQRLLTKLLPHGIPQALKLWKTCSRMQICSIKTFRLGILKM
jgi:hypothetical protein